MSGGDKTDTRAVKDKAAEAANDVSLLVAQAVEAMHKVVDDLSRRLNAADPAEAVAALKDVGKAASDNISAFGQDASDLGRAKLNDLSVAVRRNPLTWLALAAGVGLIVGLLRNRDSGR